MKSDDWLIMTHCCRMTNIKAMIGLHLSTLDLSDFCCDLLWDRQPPMDHN